MQRVTGTRRTPPQNWMPVRRGRVPRNVECFPRVEMPIRIRDSTCGSRKVLPVVNPVGPH